jgi:hypothetical protein
LALAGVGLALGRPALAQERLWLDPQTGKFHALSSV